MFGLSVIASFIVISILIYLNYIIKEIDKKYYHLMELESKNLLEIKIKYFNNSKKLKKINIGDWIDLYSNEDIIIEPHTYTTIHLGIAMELPNGYEAYIVPRSSTYKQFGIIQANHFGIIDNSYSGNNDQWIYGVISFKKVQIHKGDKICQFRINKIMPKVKFKSVKTLNSKSRGGIGSTGKK